MEEAREAELELVDGEGFAKRLFGQHIRLRRVVPYLRPAEGHRKISGRAQLVAKRPPVRSRETVWPYLEACEPDPGGTARARLGGSLHALPLLGGRVLVVQLSSEFDVEDVWPQEAVGEVLEYEHLAR